MVNYKYFNLFWQDSIDKQAKIEYSGGVMTNEELFQGSEILTESLCTEKELRFGCCEASSLKFKVANIVKPLIGEWITFSIIPDHHESDPLKIGRYKVTSDKPAADRKHREVTAYDSMHDILNADVTEWYNTILPDETSIVTLKRFRESFLQHFGLVAVLPEGGLVNDNMAVERAVESEQMSGKDVITAICEINGCFGHVGRDGKFHFICLPQAIEGLYPADNLFPDHAPDYMVQAKTGHLYPQDPKSTQMGVGTYIKCTYEDYVTKRITKLQIRQKENDIGVIYGDGDNCYIIEDNFLAYGKSSKELREIAENVFGKITDIVYRPFDATCMGNPCMEVGDPVRFPTKYEIVESYILQRTLKGIQALRDSYNANGVERYAEEVNSVHKSIIQLKGKANSLTRTIEETRLEMSDMEKELSNTITATAQKLSVDLQNTKDDLETSITATAGRLETEIKNTRDGLEASIDLTDKELRVELSNTKAEIESSIAATAGRLETEIDVTAGNIRAEVAQTYETQEGAETQYNSIRGSIDLAVDKINLEVSRATAAEGNLSSQISLANSQIVLKTDANGKIVQVALGADPKTGSEFRVDADNINLTANDVMNLMAGGTLNLSAMNINITSKNWSVDSQGNMVCNNLSAVTFTGRAVEDLNDAIWNSNTMKRVNEIIEIFDKRMGLVEELLTNDKVIYDDLDAGNVIYQTTSGHAQKLTITSGHSPFVIDGTGYTKLVVRVKGIIDGTPSGTTANTAQLKVSLVEDGADGEYTQVFVTKSSWLGTQEGIGYQKWADLTFDITNHRRKTAIPVNVFLGLTSMLTDGGAVTWLSRIALTNR